MKFGKVISSYYNDIVHNDIYNIDKSYNVHSSLLHYKILKKLIKLISEDGSSEYSEDECPICMEIVGTNYIKLSCSHKYHEECLIKTLIYSNKCPLCRGFIPEKMPSKLSESSILKFLATLVVNIQYIEKIHNNIKNMITNELNKVNCISIIFKKKKINYLKTYLNKFDKINYIGIIKIIKKFSKKTKYNIRFIINMCQYDNFYKNAEKQLFALT